MEKPLHYLSVTVIYNLLIKEAVKRHDPERTSHAAIHSNMVDLMF